MCDRPLFATKQDDYINQKKKRKEEERKEEKSERKRKRKEVEKGKSQYIQQRTVGAKIDFKKTSLRWLARMKLYSNEMHVSVTVPLVSNPSTYDSNVGQTSIRRSFALPHEP